MFKRWRLLSIFFLLVGLANLIRVWTAIYIAPALAGRALSLPLPFLGGLYLLCGLGFFIAGIVYWRRQTQQHAMILAVSYQTVLWALRLVADRSDYARSLWPRDALLTFAFLALIIILVYDGRRESGIKNHESASRITNNE